MLLERGEQFHALLSALRQAALTAGEQIRTPACVDWSPELVLGPNLGAFRWVPPDDDSPACVENVIF